MPPNIAPASAPATAYLFSLCALCVLYCSGCTTLLLKDDFTNRPTIVSNDLLVGNIPGDPDGDRITTIHPTVSMVDGGALPGVHLSVRNRVDYEIADPPRPTKRYIINWEGFQQFPSSTNTRVEFLNEAEDVVLRLRFNQDQLELESGETAVPPVFNYSTLQGNSHQISVHLFRQGTGGSTSYANVYVEEENGAEQEWLQMQLLNNDFDRLTVVRFRAEAGGPYAVDNLAVNGLD